KPTITPSEPPVLDPEVALAQLSRLFDRTLRALGDAGQTEAACELAAQGWKLLRNGWPREGVRLDGTMHYLTRASERPRRSQLDRDLDVRHLVPAERHRVIFEEWRALAPGSAYVLVNDH